MRINDTSVPIKPSPCRTCGRLLDNSFEGNGNDSAPEEGDLSICVYCGEIAQYDANLGLVNPDLSKATKDELDDLYRFRDKVVAFRKGRQQQRSYR